MIRLKHLPLDDISISSPYGARSITVNGRYYWWHNGLDLKAQLNTPVYAVADGEVMAARYDNSYGYYIAIDHGKFGTLYAHLSHYKVTEGSIVKSGEIIGENTVEAVNTGNDLIKTDAVFMLRDAVAPAALIDGLELDGNFINTNKHMETNIPGLYAAGDITGKPLQLSKAIGEGLIAAQHAALQIDKKENLNGRKY
jgi:succinate dehydrogenase/fumarate reductase flavoprotein subunit